MGKLMNIALIAAGSFIAGILLAPKTGRETRQDLKRIAQGYKEKASAGLDEVKRGALSVKDELTESAQYIKQDVQDTAQAVKKATR